jgi:hypothetical protein
MWAISVSLLLPSVDKQSCTAVTTEKFYKCGNHQKCTYVAVANDRRAICPSCMNTMNSELRYVEYRARDINASSSSEGGYVKGLITYMVMDDLDVKPISMSTISAISLLTKLNVTDIGAVEEKVVDFGIDEVYIHIYSCTYPSLSLSLSLSLYIYIYIYIYISIVHLLWKIIKEKITVSPLPAPKLTTFSIRTLKF